MSWFNSCSELFWTNEACSMENSPVSRILHSVPPALPPNVTQQFMFLSHWTCLVFIGLFWVLFLGIPTCPPSLVIRDRVCMCCVSIMQQYGVLLSSSKHIIPFHFPVSIVNPLSVFMGGFNVWFPLLHLGSFVHVIWRIKGPKAACSIECTPTTIRVMLLF